MIVVANRVPTAGTLEISRKDFEGSIERRIDYSIPYDVKTAVQAAKLGKPLAEAGKGGQGPRPVERDRRKGGRADRCWRRWQEGTGQGGGAFPAQP